MSVKCSAKQFGFSAIAALLLVSGSEVGAFAQSDHDHGAAPRPQVLTAEQKAKASVLIDAVRSDGTLPGFRGRCGPGIRTAVWLRQRTGRRRDGHALRQRSVGW